MIVSNLSLAFFAAAPVPETWRSLVLAGPLDIKVKPDLSWLEQNSAVLYPLFAIGTIALLVMGVFMAWKSDEVSGVLKVEYKREILTILRREPGGVNVARLAKETRSSRCTRPRASSRRWSTTARCRRAPTRA
ncbi:MAG: hypothetical protein QM765_09685 [Myxococcales bacterium]